MERGATRFRLRLFAVMTLVVGAATVGAIFSVQRRTEADLRRNVEKRFESEFDALLAVQEAHNSAVMDHCRALVRSPRIHAAVEDGGLDLLYSIAEGELRTVLPSQAAPARNGRAVAPTNSLLRVASYRFLDSTGAVIAPPSANGGRSSEPWESQIRMQGLPEREQLGYIVAKLGDEPEAIHEIIATPIISGQTGEPISALVLIFKPIEMPARLWRNGVRTGYWVNGRIELHPVQPHGGEPAADVIRRAIEDAPGEDGSRTVTIGGTPQLMHSRTLNPGSSLQAGMLVSLYSLADFLSQQRAMRWQIIVAGVLVLAAGLLASHLIAGRLSAPVEKLEIASSENVLQRERAEAALDLTKEELQARNLELQDALAELKATQHHIIQQERLRALGEMASGIAHDFNNTLVPILGFAELLKLSPGILANREQALSYIDMIHTAAKDAASVVSRLRKFYRKHDEGEALEEVNLERLVKQTATLTRPRWKDQPQAEGVTIQIRLDLEPVPAISGEEAALRELLTNLIFNAVDAMPSGGTITLRTRRAGDAAVLEVEDTGTGMSEEVRKRCMEPFFSTKGERGTGLGLSMVFGIVQRHNGSIDIRSEEGCGTAFVITLPLHQASLEPVKGAEESDSLKPLDVLVVDDEKQVRDLLSAALTNDGHRVQMAVDGASGLRCFRDGRFDLVLTDKAMPGMSGDQMACAIKQMAPQMPIILLTGFGQFLEKDEVPGINVLLSKPVGIRSLREALATALKAA